MVKVPLGVLEDVVIVSVPLTYPQPEPVGRFRQLTETLLEPDGSFTVYDALSPAVTVSVMEVMVGASPVPLPLGEISNCQEFDIPPPGVGVCTVMVAVPASEIIDAGTWACSCVASPVTGVEVSCVAPQ